MLHFPHTTYNRRVPSRPNSFIDIYSIYSQLEIVYDVKIKNTMFSDFYITQQDTNSNYFIFSQKTENFL